MRNLPTARLFQRKVLSPFVLHPPSSSPYTRECTHGCDPLANAIHPQCKKNNHQPLITMTGHDCASLFFPPFLFSREGLTFSTNYNGKRQKLLFQVLQWMRQVLQKDCQVRGTLLLRLSRRVLWLHTAQGHHQPRTRPARPARGPNHLQRTDPHIIPCGLSVPRRFLKQCRS